MAGGTSITGSGNQTKVAWDRDHGNSRLANVSSEQARTAFEGVAIKLARHPSSKLRVYNRNSPDRELVLKRKWIFGGGRREDTAKVIYQLAEKASAHLKGDSKDEFLESVARALYEGTGERRRARNIQGETLQTLANTLRQLESRNAEQLEPPGHTSNSELLIARQSSDSHHSPSVQQVSVDPMPPHGGGESQQRDLRDSSHAALISHNPLDDKRGSAPGNLLQEGSLSISDEQEMQRSLNVYLDPKEFDTGQRLSIGTGNKSLEISRLTFQGDPIDDDELLVSPAPHGLTQSEKSKILEYHFDALQEKLAAFHRECSEQSFNFDDIIFRVERVANEHKTLLAKIEAQDTDIDEVVELLPQFERLAQDSADLKSDVDDAYRWLDEQNQSYSAFLDGLNSEARELYKSYGDPNGEAPQFDEVQPTLAHIEDTLGQLSETLHLRPPDLESVRSREALLIQSEVDLKASNLSDKVNSAAALIAAIERAQERVGEMRSIQAAGPIDVYETPELNTVLLHARNRLTNLQSDIATWEAKKEKVNTHQLSPDGKLLQSIEQLLRNLRLEENTINSGLTSIRVVGPKPNRTEEKRPVETLRQPVPSRTMSQNEKNLMALITTQIHVNESSTIGEAQRRFDRAVAFIRDTLRLAKLDDIKTNQVIREQLLKRFADADWFGASFERASNDLERLYNQQINTLTNPQSILAQSAKDEELKRAESDILELTERLSTLDGKIKEVSREKAQINEFVKAHRSILEMQERINALTQDDAIDKTSSQEEELAALQRQLPLALADRETRSLALLTDEQYSLLFSAEAERGIYENDDLDSEAQTELIATLTHSREAFIQTLESTVDDTLTQTKSDIEATEGELATARQRQATLASASSADPVKELALLRQKLAGVVNTTLEMSAEIETYQRLR